MYSKNKKKINKNNKNHIYLNCREEPKDLKSKIKLVKNEINARNEV
jgi:hypothetical protein